MDKALNKRVDRQRAALVAETQIATLKPISNPLALHFRLSSIAHRGFPLRAWSHLKTQGSFWLDWRPPAWRICETS